MGTKRKTYCKRGHLRSLDNVRDNGSCIPCSRETTRDYYKANTEECRERTRQWGKNNPERNRAVKISCNTNLDKEIVYNYLLERGNINVCDICQLECPTGNKLALDHNHETNEIRGFLCAKCNQGLGQFNDSIKLLERAIEYLGKKL